MSFVQGPHHVEKEPPGGIHREVLSQAQHRRLGQETGQSDVAYGRLGQETGLSDVAYGRLGQETGLSDQSPNHPITQSSPHRGNGVGVGVGGCGVVWFGQVASL